MLDELPHATLRAGTGGRGGADHLPLDPPLAQGRSAVQLADVPVADASASDAAESAGSLAFAPAAGGRALLCWRLRLPGRSCVRRPGSISATSSSAGSPCSIDTSASMRRGDLWPRAQALASQVLDECRPTDQLAVFAFDAASRPLLSFHESATLDPARRQAIARAHLDRLAPTWSGTNLGQALVDTVAAIEDVADTSEKTARMPRRVVLISDLPQGSRLDALGDFEWPSDVELDLKTVTETRSNAGLERLADQSEAGPAEADTSRRVRVVNNPGSRREKFELTWSMKKESPRASRSTSYVPPGESRVVRVPRPPANVATPVTQVEG